VINPYLNRDLLKLSRHLFSDSRWPLLIGWFPCYYDIRR